MGMQFAFIFEKKENNFLPRTNTNNDKIE